MSGKELLGLSRSKKGGGPPKMKETYSVRAPGTAASAKTAAAAPAVSAAAAPAGKGKLPAVSVGGGSTAGRLEASSGAAGAGNGTAAPGAVAGAATAKGYKNRGTSSRGGGHVQQHYGNSTWHENWCRDVVADNFREVTFKFRRHGKDSPAQEVVQLFARRQSRAHIAQMAMRYTLSTNIADPDNLAHLAKGRERQFPAAIKSSDPLIFTNGLYNDMVQKFHSMAKSGDIVDNTVEYYSSGAVVPEDVVIDKMALAGTKGASAGVTISGLDELYHTRRVGDTAARSDADYNVIISSGDNKAEPLYEYYPMDHVADHETFHGPIGKANFDNSFGSDTSGNVVDISMTSPLFLFMLANLDVLFDRYKDAVKAANTDLSEWEVMCNTNLCKFYQKAGRSAGASFATTFSSEELSELFECIQDVRNSRLQKTRPPWTCRMEGAVSFYVPLIFKTVLFDFYTGLQGKECFDRSRFGIQVTDLSGQMGHADHVAFELDVCVFMPISFGYVRVVA